MKITMKIAMKISPENRLNLAEVYSCRSSVLNLVVYSTVLRVACRASAVSLNRNALASSTKIDACL